MTAVSPVVFRPHRPTVQEDSGVDTVAREPATGHSGRWIVGVEHPGLRAQRLGAEAPRVAELLGP